MMGDDRGQALIEGVAFFMSLTLMVICFLGFTKWFLVKQKLFIAVRQGALLYSSGRITEPEVRHRMTRFLLSGSPALVESRLQISIGHRLGFQDVSKQLDIVKIRYTSESSWYRFTNLNPTLEEKCIIKHAATYGPGLRAVLRPSGELAGRPTRLRLILFAALIAAIAFLFSPLSGWRPGLFESSDAAASVPVLVTTHYVPAFRVIRPEAVEVRRFPASFVPPGALNNYSELASDSGQSLYASVVAIPAGQPLTRAVLIDAGQKQRLASLLRPGRVAVSFSAEKSRAAGGWVQPGDTVAIFETYSLPMTSQTEPPKMTKLLFSALQVLAVDSIRLGQSVTEDKDQEKNALLNEGITEDSASRIITVLAMPGEAAALLDAREKGTLSVVLRALGDDMPWAMPK